MTAHPPWTTAFLSAADFEAIGRAIREAEGRTSAEIRVHLERHVKHRRWGARTDPLERARRLFTQLGMHRTAERHGVLIYLALEDRKLAVIGDQGIHARVGDRYWQRVCGLILERLRAGSARDGIVLGIAEVARVLGEHFPRRPHDTNELSDDVSVS